MRGRKRSPNSHHRSRFDIKKMEKIWLFWPNSKAHECKTSRFSMVNGIWLCRAEYCLSCAVNCVSLWPHLFKLWAWIVILDVFVSANPDWAVPSATGGYLRSLPAHRCDLTHWYRPWGDLGLGLGLGLLVLYSATNCASNILGRFTCFRQQEMTHSQISQTNESSSSS